MKKPVAIWNCTLKKRFRSAEEAAEFADFLCSTKNVYVDIYHCNICEGWHLTRSKVL